MTVLELGETELPDQAKQETLQEGGGGGGGGVGWSDRGSKTSSHRDATLPATEGRLWYGRATMLITEKTEQLFLPLLQPARRHARVGCTAASASQPLAHLYSVSWAIPSSRH